MASSSVSRILGKRQCQRQAVKDGSCTIHHPTYIKSKDAAKQKHFQSQDAALKRHIAIDAAKDRVVRAAVRWVNRNDDGRAETAHLSAGDNLELARAVAALEKARKK